MRKILIVAAVIFVMFSTQSGLILNVDSAQKSVIASNDSTCDWPMFGRTPDGNRVVPDGCGFDDTELSEKWTKKISTREPCQPIIVGDRMFISFQDTTLYCINIENGEILWKFVLNHFIFTPAYYNNKIFFGSAGAFYCLDADDGKIVWQVDIPEFKGSSYNLIIYKEKIYFSGDGEYFCLEMKDGSTIWSINRDYNVSFFGLAIANDNVYLLINENELHCVDYKTGNKKWGYKAGKPKYLAGSYIVVAEGKVFFSPEEGFTCLDQVTGKLLWKNDYSNHGVVCYKNRLYFSWNLKMNVLDSKTGVMIWESDRLYPDRQNLIYDNEKIIFMRKDKDKSKLNVLDLKTQKITVDIYFADLTTIMVAKDKLFLISVKGDISCYVSGYSRTVPNKILINSSSNILDTCQTTQLSVKVFNQYNQEIKASFQWSVDPPESGTIDSSGLFTPKKTGKVKITCKSGNLTESITIDVFEYLTSNCENVKIVVENPKYVAQKTVIYTNNSDRKLSVNLVSNLDLVTVAPSSFVIEPGKSQEASVSVQLASFAPVPDTEFIITATYDTCAKKLQGLLTSSTPFACLSASPDSLAFGMVKRGNTKTMSLSILSEVNTNITVTSSEPWISVSAKELQLQAGIPAAIELKIQSSSLPPSSKLSASITIKSATAFCNVLTIPVTVETEENITIKLAIDSKYGYINGQERVLDSPPKIIGGRTMVPLRFISEAFGCSIEWDAKEQRIGIVRYDISVFLWIGKDYVEVNGQKLKIDSPPVIVGSRTMVPLRFIAEPFGAKVDWNAQTKQITIVWPKP